jgi:four helix bundle protein
MSNPQYIALNLPLTVPACLPLPYTASMPARSFRDLIVWQRAIELALSIYATTAAFPKEELFGLTSQLRRAAVSIPSNIAEGESRITPDEFKQFLGIARGSSAEVQTQLVLARRLQLAPIDLIERSESLIAEVHKMLNSLIAKQ